MGKKLLLSAAAIAIATPAFAADLYAPYVPPTNDPVYTPGPMVVGHLTMGIGFVNFDGSNPFEDDTVGIFTGAGRANINLGGAWNLELETGGTSIFDNGYSFSSVGVGGHLWTRLNGGAVGVYGAADFPSGATVGTAGVEGQAYLGNVTLGANASYSWSDNLGDFWQATGIASIYVTPDLKLGGSLAYGDFDGFEAWSAGLNTEYRFSGTPFSAWGDVNYSSYSSGGPDVLAGLVGFRIFMDGAGTTLQQHDRDVPWEGVLSTNFTLGGI